MPIKVSFFLLGFALSLAAVLQAQQPAAPPDCQTQLGLALNRMGTAQTLAREDREALILYFQAELRKKMAELDQAVHERDELRKQVDEATKKGKEPGS